MFRACFRMLAVILVSDFCNVNSQRIYTAADFSLPQPKHFIPFSPNITWARGSNSLRVTWYKWDLCVLYSLRAQELVKVEVAVLGSPSQMYCLYGLCGHKATLNLLRSCVKVEAAVLGSPSLIVCTCSVDVKQH